MGNAVQENNQQVQVSAPASFLEQAVHLGQRIVEVIRSFYVNMRMRLIYSNEEKEKMRHKYDEKPELTISNEKTEEINEQVVALMSEVFHGTHPGEYLASISSLEERQAVVEIFAKQLLELYGLTEVQVVMEYESVGLCGYYSFDRKILCLNKSFLALDDPILLLDAVDTILHETRHALQHAAMHDHNPLAFDQDTLIAWVKNLNNYIRPENDPEAYRNQPVEADAFSSAEYTIHTYFQANGIQS